MGERQREGQLGEKEAVESFSVGGEFPFGNRIFSLISCSQEGKWENRASFQVERNPAARENARSGMAGWYSRSDRQVQM